MKILVADDSKTTLALLTDALEKMGHIVTAVNNGAAAIECYQQSRPDLVILDVVMENMDGFECARRLRILDPDDWIPIIFLSGVVDDENIAKGIDAGGDDYLTKPFSTITLSAKIKAMQRISDMRQKLYKTTKKLRLLSATDRLTGLYNRLKFEKKIKEKTIHALKHHYTIALLFLDLDQFKTINDTLGHHIGDKLLQEVALRLKKCLRKSDFIARLGGDEFAIILDDIKDPKIVSNISQHIIQVVSQPYNLSDNYVQIGASIGIAYYPSSNTSLDSLLVNADIAMYHAKEVGKNNYQYFTDELNEKYEHHIYLQTELKNAIKKNALFLKYQPIFDLKTRQIVRVEALIHWSHEKLGVIPAAVFIPLAEELGIIETLETWVFETVCQQSLQWIKLGIFHFKISINISPRELLQKKLPNWMENRIKELAIPPYSIELELAETSALSYSGISQEIINKIQRAGIGIVLDDFGAGYSSLAHLKQLIINAVKIDKIIINDAIKDNHSRMIMQTIIEFGKNLKFDVIAEGIESKEQLELVIKAGCPQGQGYFLSEPLELDKMTTLLQTNTRKENP